jgi:hypothetical protein
MFIRLREFAVAEAATFPATTVAGRAFAEIGTAITEFETEAAHQAGAGGALRGGTANKADAREDLEDMLVMMRRTARAMAQTVSGLREKFRVPRNATDVEILATAETFVTDATPLKNDFIEYGLPATFLEDLNVLMADLREAMDQQAAGRRQQVTSTASLSDILSRAYLALKRVDPIVRNTFRNQPNKLAAWESARHVERAPRRSTQGSAPGATPAPQ